MALNFTNKSVGVVNPTTDITRMLQSFGFNYESVKGYRLDEYDFILFTGGADVDPNLYGDTEHSKTSSTPRRDYYELELFYECAGLGIPMVGICRGAQFLTVANGGKLFQDVNNHRTKHLIICNDWDANCEVSSTHHQMMYPYCATDYRILAYSRGLSEYYQTGENISIKPKYIPNGKYVEEPEVVYYPLTNSLAVQFHPEYDHSISPSRSYFKHLLDKYVV